MKKLIILLLLLIFIPNTVYSTTPLEKQVSQLEQQLQQVTGKERVAALNRLARMLYLRQPNRAITFGSKALKLAEEIEDIRGKGRALIYLANAYRGLGEIKKPFKYGRDALSLFRNLGDKQSTVDALNTLGYLYRSIDSYNEAQKYLIEALEICDKMAYVMKRSGILYQLGSLYIRLHNPQKAMIYYRQAYEIAEKEGNQGVAAYYLNTIGRAHREIGEYEKALECFKKSLRIFEKKENSFGISAATGNIGKTYGFLNNFSKAVEYLQRAIKTAEDANNMTGVCHNLYNIGNEYLKVKDYQPALTFFEKALIIAKDSEDNNAIKIIYEYLANLYIATKNYKKALDYRILLGDLKDRLLNEKKNQQIAELQQRYEAGKRARDIVILKKTNQNQRLARNTFIAGFVIVLVLLVLLFRKYQYLFLFWKKQKYIGQYRLLEICGSGGMSTVFKAHSIKDKNEIVAVKVLKDELFNQEHYRQRFKQEGTIIDQLKHPNIIDIYERGEYDGKLFIVMEFLDGDTLSKKLETGGVLPFNDCLCIMKQMAAALAFIHSKNIIHRDLKPGNIMMAGGSENVVKLLDFGLSKMKFQPQITRTGVLVGTANYMAPEQISDLQSSPACDVFTLGLIYFQMLTGKMAFTGDTYSEIEMQILNTKPPDPFVLRPEIPEKINHLIMAMLSKNPGQRPSAESVLTRLEI